MLPRLRLALLVETSPPPAWFERAARMIVVDTLGRESGHQGPSWLRAVTFRSFHSAGTNSMSRADHGGARRAMGS